MTAENFDHILHEFQHRQPFQPFTVELTSGRRFEVDYPGALVYRKGVAVFISPGGYPILFDHESVSDFTAAPASAQE